MSQSNSITCISCGAEFTFSATEQAYYQQKKFAEPKRCPACRKARRIAREEEQKRLEEAQWAQQKAAEQQQFEDKLSTYQMVSIPDIRLKPDHTLYILGNGFDMMHGVKSSYYDFAATIGKNNSLRFCMETYLNVENLWGDFEEALGHLNVSMMMNPLVVDMWLDDFGAYDPDAQAADFFCAVDAITHPASEITTELPRRFRMWVESLKVESDERPLRDLIQDAKVLCFNYTEFVEELYGVSTEHVCYIHGCRRKEKYHPKEKLILGHRPGAGEEEWERVDARPHRFKNPYKRYIMESAFDTAARNLLWYEDDTTKNCREIIRSKSSFFEGLSQVNTIVVIGHSLSQVDWDYFAEVIRCSAEKLHWYIGCHGLKDLQRLDRFMEALDLSPEDVTIFKT